MPSQPFAHIDAFVDLVSPYAYFGATYILAQRPILLSYNTTLTIHPVYLGAIQVTTKNVPPFQIPAKAHYSKFDTPRAAAHFKVPYKGAPPWFPMASLKAQRLLTVFKEECSQEVFEERLVKLFEAVWVQGRNLGDESVLRDVLVGLLGSEKHDEVERVMGRIGEKEVKDKLIEVTNWAIELGAFGMPFFSVTDAQGRREPFFGSDRFEYMWEFLGLPVQRMRIREKGEAGESKL